VKRESGKYLNNKSHILKMGILKVGKMEKIKAKVDERGRIIIPARVRRKMKIEPMTKIDIRIERVLPRKSFVQVTEGLLEGAGDAVKLLHEKSPFR